METGDPPRVVLGLVDGLHDAGAAVVVDGRIVAAANEERFTRVKLQGGFPRQSLRSVLATAGVGPAEVDAVAVGGCATPTIATRLFRPLQKLYGPSMGICFDRPWHPVDRIGDLVRYRLPITRSRGSGLAGRLEARLAEPILRRSLPPGLRGKPITFVDHHLAHAESAWRTSGDGRWLVVTADAHGDGRSLTVHLGETGRPLVPLAEVGVTASVGAFYSAVTKHLGFRPGRHEGKVLGLAAFGDAGRIGAPFPFAWDGDALRYRGAWGLAGARRLRELGEVRREDLAAWLQRGTEQVLVEGVRRWLRATDARQVALAGGVFANVRVNGLLAELDEVGHLHVFPHMGDGGLAAGAALHVAARAPAALGSAFLGPAPQTRELEAAVAGAGLPAAREDDPDAVLVEAVARGQPAVRYTGPMEYGPRALGHRSVLAPADRTGISDPLNRALEREAFMPFAPALTHEEAGAAFDAYPVAEAAVRYMTVALRTREAFARACPAAVHVDGTARPQVVRREEDPDFHRLLERYRERSGLPALINTSFNLHEEPIVQSPQDAVRAFRRSGLPWMRLGPFVVRNPDSTWRPRRVAAQPAMSGR